MWVLAAAAGAFFMALHRMVNQVNKHPAFCLTFLTKLFLALLSFPFLFFVEWPTSPWFYVLVGLTAPLAAYLDKSLYTFTARHGAGPVTRMEPLRIPFVFIAWLVLNPSLFMAQLEAPLVFAGICFCLGATTYFASRIKACPINGAVLRAMVPVILVGGAVNLLAKGSTEFMPQGAGVALYVFIQSVLVAAISIRFVEKKDGSRLKALRNKNVLKAAFLLSWFLLAIIVLRLWAFMGSSNPAYVIAIMLTSPLWALLFNRILKHKEEGSILSGLGIVLSVFVLTLLTAK